MTEKLRANVCVLSCLVAAACTAAPSDLIASPYELQFIPITDDITLAYRPDVPRFPVVGNAVIVPVDGGVVLVDGGGSAAVVDQILAFLNANELGPIKYLVLSHWHSDHSVSLDRYLEVYPEAQLVSHPWTKDRIVERLVDRVSGLAEKFEQEANVARKELATGLADKDGQPLSEMQRRRTEELLADFSTIHAQKVIASATVPGLTTTGMTLPEVGRRIELQTLGCGNTPGDLVVWLPAEKVLIGGDILTWPVPFGFPPCPTEVITTTERLLSFDFDYLVLGHGGVQLDRTYGDKVLSLQRHAVAEIYRLYGEGFRAKEIASRLDLSPYDLAITHGEPDLEYFFDIWYRQQIVERTVREIEAK